MEDVMQRAAARYSAHNARTIAELTEPRERALIACQVPFGIGQTWTNRTYEVARINRTYEATSCDDAWLIDLGDDAPPVPRRSWQDVREWLRIMGARDVEILEVA